MSYKTIPTKQRSCRHCGAEFTATKKGSYGWREYCPKCTRDRVWLGKWTKGI